MKQLVLILTVLMCIAMRGMVVFSADNSTPATTQSVPDEKPIILRIKSHGGEVEKNSAGQVISVEMASATDADLADLRGFRQLRELKLEGVSVSDAK